MSLTILACENGSRVFVVPRESFSHARTVARFTRESFSHARTVFARENRGAFRVNPQILFRFFYDPQLDVSVGADLGKEPLALLRG